MGKHGSMSVRFIPSCCSGIKLGVTDRLIGRPITMQYLFSVCPRRDLLKDCFLGESLRRYILKDAEGRSRQGLACELIEDSRGTS